MACGCGKVNCGCGNTALIAGCGSSYKNCDSVQSRNVPYYAQGDEVQENHCQQIINDRFSSVLCALYSFVVPNCNSTVDIFVAEVSDLLVGSYLWNDIYGYFLVIAFDKITGQVTLENTCIQGNAAPGFEIPACTCFTVSPPPCPDNNLVISYVAEDFVVPNVSSCTDIVVTSTEGLVEGSEIQISSGSYTLDSILTETTIRICNEGEGGTPGSTVVALNGSGNYQYPVITLTGNTVLTEGDTDSGTINTVSPILTVSDTMNIVNPSSVSPMVVLYTIEASVNGDADDAFTNLFTTRLDLKYNLDGGGLFTPISLEDTLYVPTDGTYPFSQNGSHSSYIIIPPSGSASLYVEAVETFTGAAGADYIISELDVVVTAIGVIG